MTFRLAVTPKPVSRPRFVSTVLLALSAFAVLSTSALAEGRKFNELTQREESVDRPGEREADFLQGRRAPAGKNPATLRQQAHEKKMEARTLRAQQAKLRTAIRSAASATVPVGDRSTVWRAIGPVPIRPQSFLSDNSGPVTGRVTAVAVDQTDTTGNTVFVGGAYGGVWKSTNAAASDPTAVVWTPLTDDQATLSVGSIAVSPADHNVILVGTGEAKAGIDSYYGLGIMRSADGGQSWTLIRTGKYNGSDISLAGLGIGHIAFSSDGATAVASSMPSSVGMTTGLFTSTSVRGLWTSKDAGQTWSSPSVIRNGVSIQPSAHSVIYNPQQQKFYAALRYQGIFQSSDGLNWTPTSGQMPFLNLTNCPTDPASNSYACSFWRGELAMRPGRDEMYLWVVDANDADKGVFKSTDGGATWIQMDQTGIDSCGDSTGCGGYQTFFNMAIAAVPNPTDSTATDVYVGSGNWWKCTVNAANPTCTGGTEPYRFMNITHVYGCNPEGSTSNVHPDQHAIDFSVSNPNIIYFGNDGGVYRTINSTGLNTGSCSPAGGHLPFGNLNTSLGSLAQYNHATPDPSDATGFIAGAQDNGTSMTNSAIASPGKAWQAVMGGDGGHTAINPNTPTTVYSALTDAIIGVCTAGYSCTDNSFNYVTDNSGSASAGVATLGNDSSAFYAPFILDPQLPSKMLVGTCRVWRGTASTSFGGTALSFNPFTGTATTCASSLSNDEHIFALAVGGPSTTNGSQVIYAGYGTGQMIRTLSADGGISTWVDVSPSTLDPNGYRISDIAIDQSDSTGKTAYATVMGFSTAHVLKTTNGGTSWTAIGQPNVGGLPDAPANTVVLDPDDSSVVYIGTDVGVFVTSDNGTTWTEVGPSVPSSGATGYLPNVVVSHLAISKAGGKKQLVASTYGRGVWAADLGTGTTVQDNFNAPVVTSASSATVSAGSSATYTISVSPGSTGTFTGTITFSCSGLPSLASCNFSPASVVPNTSTQTTTLTISTTAKSTTAKLSPRRGTWTFALALLLPGLALSAPRQYSKRVVTLAVLAIALTMLVAMTACGGGGGGNTTTPPVTNPGTPAGSYSVTISATSGSTVKTTTVTLVVQ